MTIRDKIESLEQPWQDEEILRELYTALTQEEIAEVLGCQQNTISKWMDRHGIETGWKDGDLPYEKVALFSGGHDSLVSTHYVMEELDGDVVVHIDTGTGLDENRDFVESVCDEFGWDLEIITSDTSLQKFAKKWGFPKPASHSWIYRYLKEHPLSKFATRCARKPHYYTGVRKHESERRMETVSAESEERDQWVWHSPIAEFTQDDVEVYIHENNLPRNPVVEKIGRSGECFCGAFADREQELETLHENYPEHFQWVTDVEESVQKEIGMNDEQCFWGVVEDEEGEDPPMSCTDMKLCEDCGNHR